MYKLADEMPYEELLAWMNYLERRPVGWRDDDRTYKYLQTQGVKEKPWRVFGALKAIYQPTDYNAKPGQVSSSFRGSDMFARLLSAKGGDKLDL